MKKKIIIALGLALICTGCGSKDTGDTSAAYDTNYMSGMDGQIQSGDGFSETYGYDEGEALYDYDPEMSDAAYEEAGGATEAAADVTGDDLEDSQSKGNENAKLSKEMLVYRGVLSIDTLDFNKSVNDFKSLLKEKGGFVESESYSDNYSTNGYYVIDEADKRNVYTATVRVPSAEYDTMMNSATNLGDVRNRTSNASNVTQQYNTYTSQLEIYEAEYKRYLSLLEKATEDEYALQIENELFDIQIKIANLKSSISNIENDVTYSYIDITIKEVSEYEEEPVKTDTFIDRLKNTCRNSWSDFLDFVEDILFYVIRNIYYIVIWGVIIFAVYRFIRKKRRAKTNAGKSGNVQEGSIEAPKVTESAEEKHKQDGDAD